MSDVIWAGGNGRFRDPEERRALFAVFDSFYRYTTVTHLNTTHVRRKSFHALPGLHWETLSQAPFNYLTTLDAVDEAIDVNGELATAILQSGLQWVGLARTAVQDRENPEKESLEIWQGTATSNDLDKAARSTLRQFYRDWSEEGAAERGICHGPRIQALRNERARHQTSKRLRVILPGAGLGRLVFDLCKDGFDVEGNEISYHQLLASSYIFNYCPGENIHSISPWIHSFSNHRSRARQLQSVKDLTCIPQRRWRRLVIVEN